MYLCHKKDRVLTDRGLMYRQDAFENTLQNLNYNNRIYREIGHQRANSEIYSSLKVLTTQVDSLEIPIVSTIKELHEQVEKIWRRTRGYINNTRGHLFNDILHTDYLDLIVGQLTGQYYNIVNKYHTDFFQTVPDVQNRP